jgi:hypothetical protein
LDANSLRLAADEKFGNGRLVVERGAGCVEKYAAIKRLSSWNRWEWKQWMPGALLTVALPNAHTLIGGMGRVAEIDGNGRAVWSTSFPYQSQQVRPCLHRVRLGFDAQRTEVELGAHPTDWLQGLASKESSVRRRSAAAIRHFDPWAIEAALPSVTTLENDPDETVRVAAKNTSEQLNPDVDPMLLKAMRDKNTRVQQDAALKLYDGRLPSKVVETLIGLLRDEDPNMRWWAPTC